MIEIVINYDENKNLFKAYEPTSDTMLVTATLSDSLLKLNEFLKSENMIENDLLSSKNISYHIDSETMSAIIKSNVELLKRLSTAPSGFTTSNQRFNSSNNGGNFGNNIGSKKKWKYFSGSFRGSYKKFGGSKL